MIRHVIDELAPIREARAALERKPQAVEEILAGGNRAAKAVAADTMAEVREAVGL